jgi:hypothetical protein
MTTVIIDEKSKKGKFVSDLMKELGIGKIVIEKSSKKLTKHNKITFLAIKDAIEVNTIKCDSFEDYLEKVIYNHQ